MKLCSFLCEKETAENIMIFLFSFKRTTNVCQLLPADGTVCPNRLSIHSGSHREPVYHHSQGLNGSLGSDPALLQKEKKNNWQFWNWDAYALC